jgi:hypothetical protein
MPGMRCLHCSMPMTGLVGHHPPGFRAIPDDEPLGHVSVRPAHQAADLVSIRWHAQRGPAVAHPAELQSGGRHRIEHAGSDAATARAYQPPSLQSETACSGEARPSGWRATSRLSVCRRGLRCSFLLLALAHTLLQVEMHLEPRVVET